MSSLITLIKRQSKLMEVIKMLIKNYYGDIINRFIYMLINHLFKSNISREMSRANPFIIYSIDPLLLFFDKIDLNYQLI